SRTHAKYLSVTSILAAYARQERSAPAAPFSFAAEDVVHNGYDAPHIVVVDAVIDGFSVPARCHKPIEPQTRQLLRHRRLAERKYVFKLRHGTLPLRKQAKEK